MPEVLEDIRKRDDKARTFALSDDDNDDNYKMKKLAEITKTKLKLGKLETPDVLIKPIEKPFDKIKRSEDFEKERILKNINKYEDINLSDVNNLIDEIEKNITMSDNVLDLGNDEYVYFNDISDFLHNIEYGVINNLNREKIYNAKFRNIENKLANKKNYSRNIRLYEKYLNELKNMYIF